MSGQFVEALANLPALQTDGPVREAQFAWPIFESIPPGCIPWGVTDERHAPLLEFGMFAVIDTTDRTICPGELYLVNQSHGPVLWQLNPWGRDEFPHADPGVTHYRLTHINRPRSFADLNNRARLGVPVWADDGPIGDDHLADMVMGKVVGIADPSTTGLRQAGRA